MMQTPKIKYIVYCGNEMKRVYCEMWCEVLSIEVIKRLLFE
jgi:hypothetical protein